MSRDARLPTRRWEVISLLAQKLQARDYLEIGVQAGDNFRRIQVENKTGVDPDPASAATVHQTSNTFFASIYPPDFWLDLVFLDGMHTEEQVYADFLNASIWLRPGGAVVVHDCSPPSEIAAGRSPPQSGAWCGDVWRGWLSIRRYAALRGWETLTVDCDLGCGVVLTGPSADPAPLPASLVDGLPVSPTYASWEQFQQHRRTWLNLVSPLEFARRCELLRPVSTRP